jgi:hypothetical protein
MKYTSFIYAATYALLLSGIAYYFGRQENPSVTRLNNSLARVLTTVNSDIVTSNELALGSLELNMRANPRYSKWYYQAIKLHHIANAATLTLTALAQATDSKPAATVATAQHDAAIKTVNAMRDSALCYIEHKATRAEMQETMVIAPEKAFKNLHPTVFFAALQHTLASIENTYSRHCLDMAGGRDWFQLPSITAQIQVQNGCLYAGNYLKGYMCRSSSYRTRQTDTIFINKKPYSFKNRECRYTAPPRPAGTYPLIIEGNFLNDTKPVHLCDTLYYTVQ